MKDASSASSAFLGALSIIRGLISAISRADPIEELFEAALGALTGMLSASRAAIVLMDQDGKWRIKASRGLSPSYHEAEEHYAPWSTRDVDFKAVVVPDLRNEPVPKRMRQAMQAEGIAAAAFIPLVGKDGLLGRCSLYYDSAHRFELDEIEFGHIVAGHLAFGIDQERAALVSKASEERFAKAFSANPDPMAIHNTRDGRFVEVNDSFLKISGCTKEEVIGRTIRDLGYLTDESDFAQAAAILRDRGRLRDYEFQFRTKAGETRWGMVSAEPIDIGGERYILSTTSDITARKQIEAVLERQSQRAALRADITSALSRRCSLPGILDRCAAAIAARLKPAFTGIWLLQEPDGPLELAASFGMTLDGEGRGGEYAFLTDPRVAEIAETGRAVLKNRAPARKSNSKEGEAGDEGTASAFAGYPLIVDDRLVGVLAMYSASPMTDDTIAALGSIADTIAQGIERRQAEERLTREHGFRRAIEDSMLAGVVTIDQQWKHTYVNPAFCEIFGWTADELLGTAPPFPYWPPEEAEAIQAAFRATLDGTINQKGFELRLMRRSGEPFDALVLISLLKNRDGQPSGWLAAIHDISERTRIERERERLLASEQAARAQAESSAVLHRTAEEQLSALVEASGVLLSSLEPDAVLSAILELSRRLITADAYAVWRYNQASGRSEVACADGLSEEYQLAAGLSGPQALGGTPVVAEDVENEPVLAHRRPLYGSEGIRSLLSVPLRVWNQQSGNITFYFRTPHRFDLVEIRIATALANLASAAISTAESFHAQMQLRVEAEEANRLKDEFLATVSHELRTPLTPLLGWTHMLRHQKVSDAMLGNALEIIERNVRAQTQIVNDILDVSRIMTGKLRLEIHATSLPPIVGAAVETVKPAAIAKHIAITTTVDPNLGPVHCDPDRFQQIVWNLLTNAIKFTTEGGAVEVTLQRSGSKAQIIVHDTGQGISPEFLPHVFDRFRQADSSYTRRHGGLGLGLAIVRHLVELHGGTVEASSAGLERGATFVVSLPLVDPLARIGTEETDSTEAAQPVPALEGLRLLLVDDEPDTLEVLALTLRHNGAQVRAVGSAAVAYEVAREWKPDVVISDIGMQEEDGYVFLGRIRSLDERRGGLVPAIALTAYASEEDRQRAMLAGYQLHLSKPVEPSELIAEITKLAGREVHH